MQGLELRDIVWESAGHHELDEESVQIARGSHAVVVAEPAVATALADALCGLVALVRGQILAGDADVTDIGPNPEYLALVPVGGGLLPHLTVAKNIEFNLDPRGSRSARADQVNDLARDVQLLGTLRLVPHALTPEQRLRVAVARALARHPSALVIEDRAGEDATCEQAVRLATAQSVAVLVITDSHSRAAALSPRVHTARAVPPVNTPESPAEPPAADTPQHAGHPESDPPQSGEVAQ